MGEKPSVDCRRIDVRADVRGHQHDGIAEIHHAAHVVGQFPFFENLQQHVPHVRVRLFNFVEQHDGIRIAPHFFGELAAFLVTDVTGRRPDEPRDIELFHVLAHVEMHERLRVAKHLFGERLGQQRLAHARRAEQQEGADGPARVLQIRARPAQRLANGGNRLVLADDDLLHFLLDGQQPLHLALLHPLQRNARPFGDDVQNVLFVHDHVLFLARGAPIAQVGLQFFLGLLFLVAHLRRPFEILVLDGAFLLCP